MARSCGDPCPEDNGRAVCRLPTCTHAGGRGAGMPATLTIDGLRGELRPFQRRFLRGALAGGTDTAALSLPRGNGKSTLAAWLAARALTPGDSLFRAGTESHIIAASVGQARRTTFKILRRFFEDRDDWVIAESQNNAHVKHRPTGTRVSVLPGNSKTAQGLVDCPLIIADEPGSWEVVGGAAVWAALRTAQGKPESAMRTILIGTLAPHGVDGHWWPNLTRKGTRGSVFVQSIEGDRKRWREVAEIRKCNPLMWRFPASRAKLLEERDEAIGDSRLKAEFLSYRLNVPSRDESTVLLTVDDWELATRRPAGERDGRPVVGLDLGGGRAFSAAVGVWPSGRVEAVAVAPGIPNIAAQEKRDRVPAGTYQRLVDSGVLTVAGGLRVQPPGALVDRIREWAPRFIVCDRFKLESLRDTTPCCPIVPRVTRWSEATADIGALRKLAKDGPLSVAPESRGLLTASLAVASVKNDDGGSVRMVKDDAHNCARDDAAAALVLAAGAFARLPKRRKRGAYLGAVGA